MKKILVIDDEASFCGAVTVTLRRAGYEVHAAGDGADGLAQAFQHRPHLIVSDVHMTGMGGLELLAELRRHPETSAVPVILMTGQPQAAGARATMNLGADDYLHKPFTMEQLLAAVRARLLRQEGVNLAAETERTLVAEQLRLLTSALESAANGIAITERDGKIIWVNHAFTKLTGYTAAEAIGQNPRVLKSGRQTAKFYADLWATILTGNVWQGELVNQRKDGSCYFEEMTITPVRDVNGEIQNFIAIKQDVSKRKQIEQALGEREARYAAMVRSISDAIVSADSAGNIIGWNPGAERIFGYAESEILGQPMTQLLPERHHAGHLAGMARVQSGGERHVIGKTVEVQGRRKDGSEFPLHLSLSEWSVAAAKFFTAIIHDLTERKKFEQELAYKRDLLQALMDNLPDHIYFKDVSSRFTRVNRALALHLGLANPEAAIGKSDADFFPPMQARQKLVDERCLLATGKPLLGLVEKSDAAVGATWVSSTKVPLAGADGKITGLVGISRDITALKQAELDRQMMELQLRQSQKLESIGQLAAGIAHEINTPTQYVGDNTRFVKDSFAAIIKVLKSHEALLAAAKAGAVTPELLARNEEILADSDLEYLYEQIPSALNETLEGVARVSKIVGAMKEFSHPGGTEKTPADLNKAIEGTVTVARNEWKYVAEVKLELEPNLPFVPCFLGEFNQCILNLIVNAAHAIGDVVKKTPDTKGLITVQTRHDGEFVEVRVTDTGTGIPEAVRPKIFEPFFTTKDVGKGTGQGLAMIYGCIVNRHGGTATFETETGKGTTFILRLPLKPNATPVAAAPPVPENLADDLLAKF